MLIKTQEGTGLYTWGDGERKEITVDQYNTYGKEGLLTLWAVNIREGLQSHLLGMYSTKDRAKDVINMLCDSYNETIQIIEYTDGERESYLRPVIFTMPSDDDEDWPETIPDVVYSL